MFFSFSFFFESVLFLLFFLVSFPSFPFFQSFFTFSVHNYLPLSSCALFFLPQLFRFPFHVHFILHFDLILVFLYDGKNILTLTSFYSSSQIYNDFICFSRALQYMFPIRLVILCPTSITSSTDVCEKRNLITILNPNNHQRAPLYT